MEYKVLWLIYYTLRTLLSSKGLGCSKDFSEIKASWKESKVFAIRLTNKVIEELECLGLWHWSVLVYLLSKGIYGDANIMKQVEALIERNVEDLINVPEKVNLLVDVLKIPRSIISRAKGLYFINEKRWSDAIKYLEESKEWELIHQILWKYIVPGFISRKDKLPVVAIATMKNLLISLEEHRGMIIYWKSRGRILKLYLDIIGRKRVEVRDEGFYANMMEKIRELLQIIDNEGTDDHILDKITDNLRLLSHKLQTEYYQQNKHNKNLEKLIPIPLQTKQPTNTTIDHKILEDDLLKMIYRASKNQQAY